MENNPHTHKEEPRSWEEEFYDVLPIISSNLTVDSKVSKIKKVFERLLSTREKEVREEMLREVLNTVLEIFATPKTEIR